MEHWTKELEKLKACSESIEWARAYPSLDAAWAECQRGDWMAWLAGRCSGNSDNPARKVLVLAMCDIARTILHLVPAGEDRPRVAIETTEAWARGHATIGAVRAASADADAAGAAAAADAAAYAAAAAADAADAASAADAYAAAADAYAAADDAAAAAHAADAAYASYAAAFASAAFASYAAAAAAAKTAAADIMRKHYSKPPELL